MEYNDKRKIEFLSKPLLAYNNKEKKYIEIERMELLLQLTSVVEWYTIMY